jgi:O-antigen ligase
MAFEPVARWISRVADVAALIALVYVGWQALFGGTHAFDAWMLQAAALGALACILDAGAIRRLPWPLLAYVGVACLSSAVHESGSRPAESSWFTVLGPALPLIILLGFVFAASHTLRSPKRLALLIVALSGAVAVIAVQLVSDRLASGFVYNRMGAESIPSVAQWGGLNQIGLLLLLGLTLTSAGVLVKTSATQLCASLVLCAAFLVVAYVNGSRSALLVMATVLASTVIFATTSGRPGWTARLMAGVVVVGTAALFITILYGKTSLPAPPSLSGDRSPIWRAAAAIAIEHPWLGVGPGNYPEAMESGYGPRHLPWFPDRSGMDQAHNAVLHAAAEIGMIGAALMITFWWWLLAACRQAWRNGPVPLIACTLFVTLAALFLRLMFDSFLDGVSATADRTRVIAGLLFAAAVAIDRLGHAPRTSA